MRSSSLVLLVSLAVAEVEPAAAAPPARSAAAVRAEATKLFRGRRYEAACRKFGEAAKLAPEDPAIAADLGLCLMKTNDVDPAIAETLRSIRLARPGGPRDDPKTRSNAYYNLKQLGVSIEVPKEGTCGALAVARGCDRPVHACVTATSSPHPQSSDGYTVLSIALTPEKARPPCPQPPCDEDSPPLVMTDGSPPSDGPADRAELTLAHSHDVTAAAVEHGDYAFTSECTVVLADACLGIVALGCEESEKGKTTVDEALLAVQKR